MSNKKELAEYEEYESLKRSKFKQQKLPGWRSYPSMFNAILFFFSLGILNLGIGIAMKIFSDEIVECEEPYNNNNTVTIPINKRMKGDIMVYYKVNNFYQNNRRFMNSRSEGQLRGKNIAIDQIKKSHECDPIITNRDLGITLPNGLNESDIAIPCGLMARSFILFNDTFSFTLSNGSDLKIDETNISRKYDRENYNNFENLEKQWLNITDEHFLVWMRTSPFANFRKLYGRIKGDLEPGINITVTINHSQYYNESEFQRSNISKSIYLTTVNSFGGKNDELALSFWNFGLLCIILGIVFIIAFKCHNKKSNNND